MFKKFSQSLHHRHLFWSLIAIFVLLCIFLFARSAFSSHQLIDTHEHIENLEKAEQLLKAMDRAGVRQTILIPSPIETITLNGNQTFTGYEVNVDAILGITKSHPERFIPFCTISPLDSDALQIFKSCHERGGQGLKLYNGHSYYYETFGIPLNSPRMKPIYAYAERNHLPILFHVNLTNYGDELEAVLKEFPDLTVSIPHFMVSSLDLDRVKTILNTYPNTYTDISFGHDPYFAAGLRRISLKIDDYKAFFSEYHNRILFGADMVLNDSKKKDTTYMTTWLKCYRHLLEKRSFTCDPVNDYYQGEADKNVTASENCRPAEGKFCKSKAEKARSYTRWANETERLNGLNLSNSELEDIYVNNPLRFLRGDQR